jgi:hypothetical protein
MAHMKSSSSSIASAGALHLPAHRALAMQESARAPTLPSRRISQATAATDAHEMNTNASELELLIAEVCKLS